MERMRLTDDYARGFHDDCNSHRLDGFLYCQGDLPCESLLHLQSSRESLCYSSKLAEAEYVASFGGYVANGDLRVEVSDPVATHIAASP